MIGPSTTCLLAALLGAPAPAGSPAPAAPALQHLTVDPEHSSASFRVRHLFTTVNGTFRELSGSIELDPAAPARSSVQATLRTASIDTNVKARDEDLRSKRFFEASTYPEVTFQSSKVEAVGKAHWRVSGQLTMHGVTRPVTLDTQFLGSGKDPWGNLRYGFHAEAKLDRKDFGLNWNETLETGGVLVGDEVQVVLDIEALPAKGK